MKTTKNSVRNVKGVPSRQSKNIEDRRSGPNKTKDDLAIAHLNQIHRPEETKKLTTFANKLGNKFRDTHIGGGNLKMKSPAGKAPLTKFLPFETITTPKTSRVKKAK